MKKIELDFEEEEKKGKASGVDDFRVITSRLKPAVGKIEGFTNFLFSGDMAAAYDGEILLALDLKGKFKPPIGVRAEPLMRIMDKIADSKPDVSVKGNELLVAAATSEFGVPVLDPPGFADVLEGFRSVPEKKWAPIPKKMLEAIYLCSFYTSGAVQAREDIIGVAVDGSDVLSTDGFRITWCKAADGMGRKLCVRVRAAQLLPRYKELNSYYVSEDNWLCLRGGGVMFCSLLLGYKFPDDKVRGFFKKVDDKAKSMAMKIPQPLLAVIERSLVYQKYEFVLDSEMVITAGDGKILCEVESKDIGWFREQFAIEDKKVKFKVSVNPVFLKEVLQHTAHMELRSDSQLRLYSDTMDHLISLK